MYDIIRNTEFTNIRSDFLDHLNKRSLKNVLVFTDKSTNLYKLYCEKCQKLLHENITQAYTKVPKNAKHDADRKTKSFAKTLKILDKMECYPDKREYITLRTTRRTLETTLNAD